MIDKRWIINLKKIGKFSIFIIIAILPFITITQLIGANTFIDSFENPDYYICMLDKENLYSTTQKTDYLIIQKSTHPNFKIYCDDIALYYQINGDIACNKINKVNEIGAITIYEVYNVNEQKSQSLYENQIVGKVITTIEDNIWNQISIKIWEISINNLNIRSLLN